MRAMLLARVGACLRFLFQLYHLEISRRGFAAALSMSGRDPLLRRFRRVVVVSHMVTATMSCKAVTTALVLCVLLHNGL